MSQTRRAFLSASLASAIYAACAASLTGCGGGDDDPAPAANPTPNPAPTPLPVAFSALPRSVSRIGRYEREQSDAALTLAQLSALGPARYAVDLWRVTHLVPAYGRSGSVEASGLVAVPDGATGPRPLLGCFHGTTTARLDVPSRPGNPEGQLVAAAFAAAGYVVAAPDYPGLGSAPADQTQTYVQADSLANAAIDLLRLARLPAVTDGIPVGDRLFLTGFSQGGYAAMAVHRALETDPRYAALGLSVAASAPVAGPYDLSGGTFDALWTDPGQNASALAALLLLGYDAVYDLFASPADIFAAPHAAQIPALFDGTRTLPEVAAALPVTPAALLRPEFVAAVRSDPAHPLRAALRANDVHDWQNTAPVRLYHGSADRTVPFANAVAARDRMTARGGAVELVDLGPVDHGGSVVPAALRIRPWFDSLTGGAL